MDVCIMRNETPVFYRSIPVGGAHIARDVAYVFDIAQDAAESIKRRHVFGLDYGHRVDHYRLSDGNVNSFRYTSIAEVIDARAREMAQLIVDALMEAPVRITQQAVIYHTGGGLSMMRGSREYLQALIGLKVSTNLPRMPRMHAANHTSAYGVLTYAVKQGVRSKPEAPSTSFWQKLLDFFTRSSD